jgi:NAD(P)H-hydrate epimerase
MACLQLGIDLVYVYAPRGAAQAIKCYSPDLIVVPGRGDGFAAEEVPQVLELAQKVDAVLVGPGLGSAPEARAFAAGLLVGLCGTDKKIVVDADALVVFGEKWEQCRTAKALLTPHRGEARHLSGGTELPTDLSQLKTTLQQLIQDTSLTILLKGPLDYIASSGRVHMNRTGVPEMAVGGTGDVLAGVCVGLASLTDDLHRIARAAAYLSGKAGEAAVHTYGNRIRASDVVAMLRSVLREIAE